MTVTPAAREHAAEIAALVNSAYRGDSSRFGWTTEADYLDGARITNEGTELLIQPEMNKNILILRDGENPAILGCVFIEKFETPESVGCYLGMLTVKPKLQDKGLGRILLDAAENFARQEWKADHMTLGVIQLRGTLMAWYERRGYKRTEITKPFPYDQPEVGIPKRQDLHFVMFEKPL